MLTAGEPLEGGRHVRVRRVSLLAPVLVLAACSNTPTGIDVQKVETTIRDQAAAAGVTVTADCPDQVSIQAGATFQCTVTLPDGSTQQAQVTQTDAAGNVSVVIE